MNAARPSSTTTIRRRRTVREFSDRPVPRAVIEDCLRAAGTAPERRQHAALALRRRVRSRRSSDRIRLEAEKEEREFYQNRAPQEWLDALAPLGTDEHKPFLETAPYLIAIFAESYGELPDGRKVKHYYAQESVGIATGLLIAAVHHAGLVSLTHTPSPMGFLNEILGRPRARAAVSAAGRWLSRGGRNGAGDRQESARGDRDFRLRGKPEGLPPRAGAFVLRVFRATSIAFFAHTASRSESSNTLTGTA